MNTEAPRPSPIFCPEMFAAILDGRKTQTRRVVSGIPQTYQLCRRPVNWTEGHEVFLDPADPVGSEMAVGSPHGGPGTVWYLREALARSDSGVIVYRQDGCPAWLDGKESQTWQWARPVLPAMFMPAWAARLWLRVTAVRVERVRDIGEADAIAEGVPWGAVQYCGHASKMFAELWDRLNAKRGHPWEANDWVWVYQFKRTEKP